MSDDTEWPNDVKTTPAALSVAIDREQPLAIATQTKVPSPGPGLELHFLRSSNLGDWQTYAAKLERSGAYAWVKLVRLTLRDPESTEEVG